MNCWQQYVDVIYMTEMEVKLLDAVDSDSGFAVNKFGHVK